VGSDGLPLDASSRGAMVNRDIVADQAFDSQVVQHLVREVEGYERGVEGPRIRQEEWAGYVRMAQGRLRVILRG
jgi:hypothetical protein